MNIKCLLGAHPWRGCRCSVCGNTRDQDHDWSRDCEKCSSCGSTRKNIHRWEGCKCAVCGTARGHGWVWNKDVDDKCSRCGATRPKKGFPATREEICEAGRATLMFSTYAERERMVDQKAADVLLSRAFFEVNPNSRDRYGW